MRPENNRRQLLRWLGWFAMANAAVLAVIDLRYLSSGLGDQTWLSWIYLIGIYIGHHAWLAALPLFIFIAPVIAFKPAYKTVRLMAVLLMSAVIAVLLLDSLLWSQSRFHINMLTLQILGLSSWIFVAVMFFVSLLFQSILSGHVWAWVNKSAQHRGKLLGALVSLCLLVSMSIFAWADATYYVPVTSVAQRLPVKGGFTAKKFLVRHKLVDVSESRERRMASRLAAGSDQSRAEHLNYPLAPLQCSVRPQARLNLVVILIDGMRSDVVSAKLTPHMQQFSQRYASRFSQHYSGGNSSRMGVFSLFYALPPGYFGSFEAIQQPPVLMTEMQEQGYQFGLFSSANMYRPVALDRTAFANIPNLRMETEPKRAPAWQRDQIMTAEWVEWLDQRSPDQPFFGFLFYDATSEHTFPADFANKVMVNPDDAMPQAFADYKTSVMFADHLVGQVLGDLEQRGLLENTVVMISADHGQEFDEHGDGLVGHGSGYSRHQLQVPMLLSWPGKAPQQYNHRTSHYDVAPTVMKHMLGCDNPPGDYAIGADLFDATSWNWLLAGSYYNYAVVEPQQVTITFPGGRYEVRDQNYRLIRKPVIHSEVLEAVMRENGQFYH